MTDQKHNAHTPSSAGLVELTEDALDAAAGGARKFDHIGNVTVKTPINDSPAFTDTILEGSNI